MVARVALKQGITHYFLSDPGVQHAHVRKLRAHLCSSSGGHAVGGGHGPGCAHPSGSGAADGPLCAHAARCGASPTRLLAAILSVRDGVYRSLDTE